MWRRIDECTIEKYQHKVNELYALLEILQVYISDCIDQENYSLNPLFLIKVIMEKIENILCDIDKFE